MNSRSSSHGVNERGRMAAALPGVPSRVPLSLLSRRVAKGPS